MILYHNTSNTNAINIFKEGIIPGKRLSVYGKGSEAEGSGIWCTSKRGYGYGGATITFKIDDNDKYLAKQNDTEYIVYRKIDTSDIIDIDLVISSLVSSNSHNTVESDIPMLIKKFGKNKVLDIFKKYDSKFIEPYNYKNFENLINTGKKLLIGNININEQYNYKFFNILNEARLNQLEQKTRQQTPKLANRADFVNTDYIGISKFGIFNFRTTSQSNPGKYWYQTLEVPDLQSKLMDENITPDLMKRLIEQDDIKLYCDCLTGDMSVLMEDGTYKFIKDIKEGDKVITHLGNIKTVKGKSNRPAFNDLLEIDLGDRKIKCTENHQFLVNNNGNKEWIYAKDLTTDMELLELGDL